MGLGYGTQMLDIKNQLGHGVCRTSNGMQNQDRIMSMTGSIFYPCDTISVYTASRFRGVARRISSTLRNKLGFISRIRIDP